MSKKYKNIKELEKFIVKKIYNSDKLDAKYKFFYKTRERIPYLVGSSFSISVIYFFYHLIFSNDNYFILLLITFMNFFFILILSLLSHNLSEKIGEININYTHKDFEELSHILSFYEMKCFISEIDRPYIYPLVYCKDFITSEEESNLREINRSKYINSLYQRT